MPNITSMNIIIGSYCWQLDSAMNTARKHPHEFGETLKADIEQLFVDMRRVLCLRTTCVVISN